ncbi:MAG: Holliday junction resolvase RuvX, partial [Firmicutes bacterium]|nr:Holliday junction resolvase RuvX [Bacillota bacterium]
DPLMITAQGVTTIERIGARKDCDKIIEYIKEYDAGMVVCGLPLMLDGSDSPQTQKVRDFAKLLENKMRSSALKVELIFQDERFTTKIAESVMMDAGLKRRERKEFVDKQAAMLILQSYMDKLRFQKEEKDG